MNSVQYMSLFEKLAQDPSYRQSFEADPNSMPIDMSVERLRKYSPFTISFALPTILDGVVASGGFDDGYLQTNLRAIDGNLRSSGVGFNSVTKIKQNQGYLDAGRGQGSITSDLSSNDIEKAETTVMSGIVSSANARASSTETMANREAVGLVSEEAGFTDQRIVIDILRQLKDMADMPPLLMLINPTSFQLQYQRIQNYSEATRDGFVYQAWGEGLPTISVSCMIGAFASGVRAGTQGLTADEVAILPPNLTSLGGDTGRQRETNVPSGVQYASRDRSASYQQLITLLNIYNSGALIKDRIGRSKANHMAGKVVLEYDKMAYLGTMKSFSYSFAEEKQMGGLEVSFEFEAKKILDFSTDTASISRYSSTRARQLLTNNAVANAPSNPVSGSFVQTTGASILTSAPTTDEESTEPNGTGFILNT